MNTTKVKIGAIPWRSLKQAVKAARELALVRA